jgi:hypothetical protein
MVHFSKSHLWLLQILTNNAGDSKLSSRLIKSASGQELLILFELAKNILQGNIPISGIQKDKLQKYETKLIFLSEPNKKVKDKIKVLLSNRSFLEQLLLIGEEFIINKHYNSEIEESDEESEYE